MYYSFSAYGSVTGAWEDCWLFWCNWHDLHSRQDSVHEVPGWNGVHLATS